MAGILALVGFPLICAWFVFTGPGYTAVLTVYAGLTALAYVLEWRYIGPGQKFLGVLPFPLRPACMVLWLCTALTGVVTLALRERLQPP